MWTNSQQVENAERQLLHCCEGHQRTAEQRKWPPPDFQYFRFIYINGNQSLVWWVEGEQIVWIGSGKK